MTTSPRRGRLLVCLAPLLAGSLSWAAEPPADAWPRFRGPAGTGVVAAGDVPVKWTPQSVVWRTELKGTGNSSPVVWGDRIFLTSAGEGGGERFVIAVDRNTGKILWEQTAWKGVAEPTHKMNGWATPTCVTDGSHVWAWFGPAGVHCYTVDGKHVWSQQLGQFKTKNARGTASSLALAGDVLVVNGDSESDPYLFGLDKATGKTVWKTARPPAEGYSTPLVVTANNRQELVLNGDSFVGAYDPASGKLLWQCRSLAGRGEPMPVPGKDGTLYVVNGLAAPVYAVRPGGDGDVSKTHLAWKTPRKEGRDQPSPLLVGDVLLVANMAGMLTGYDPATGKELWKERIGPGNVNITAAPTAAGGRGYFTFENGETVVVEPSASGPKVTARNTVNAAGGEVFRASLAPVGGRVYVRSDRAIYCVK